VLEAWFKRVLGGLALPWGHGKRFQDGMDVVEDCQEELAKDEVMEEEEELYEVVTRLLDTQQTAKVGSSFV